MRKLVYDAPTRVFHTLFSALFLCAFIVAKTVDHESGLFPAHMLIGMTISFLVILRILWGFLGTRHARFTGFALNPKDLIAYLKGVFSGDKKRWAGHNPASSWAALIMMALALSLGLTGYLMVSSGVEAYEDIHEILANTFMVVVVLHIAGVVFHSIRHRDWIALSMFEGRKEGVADSEQISDEKNAFGILLVALVAAFAIFLISGYDRDARNLTLFGTTLQLGEVHESDGHDHDHEDSHDHGHEHGDEGEGLDFLFDESFVEEEE